MRRALGILCVGWAALLLVSLVPRCRELPGRLTAATLDLPSRSTIESGDPEWHALLLRPWSGVVLAADPDREPAFMKYRAVYEKFPWPVRVECVPRFPPITRFPDRTVMLDEPIDGPDPSGKPAMDLGMDTAIWVERHDGRHLVLWDGSFATSDMHTIGIRLGGGMVKIGGYGMLPGAWRAEVQSRPADTPARVDPKVERAEPLLVFLAMIMLAAAGWWMVRGAPDSREDGIGRGLVVTALALAVVNALSPIPAWSNWDAWAVWDLKVKAIHHEGWLPVRFLTDPDYNFSHQEYPLGWPWLQTVLTGGAGATDARWLRLVSPLAGGALAWLLAALLLELGVTRGRWLVTGAVALLPLALDQSYNGYVDWPLAAAMTGAMLVTIRACRGTAPVWLAGLAAGIPGLLKNEGVVGGLACVAALALNVRRGRVTLRGLLTAAAAWLAIAGPWQGVVWSLGLKHYDYGPVTIAALAAAPHRLLLVARAMALEMFGAGPSGATWLNHALHAWLLFWPVALLAMLSGWRRLAEPGLREVALILAIQVAAASFAYTLTILDVNWLLATSLDRLLLQWVPGVAVLAAAVALRPGGVGQWSRTRS